LIFEVKIYKILISDGTILRYNDALEYLQGNWLDIFDLFVFDLSEILIYQINWFIGDICLKILIY